MSLLEPDPRCSIPRTTTREIADVVGVKHTTVERDLAGTNVPQPRQPATQANGISGDGGTNVPAAPREKSPAELDALAAALVLNRPDWLAAMGYTLAESIERIGAGWCQLIPAAAKQFKRDAEAAAYEETEKARQNKLAEFTARKPTDESIWCRSGADRSPRSGPRCVSGWRMRKPSCARSRTCTASPGGKVNRST